MEDNGFILDTMTWSFSRLESFYTCKFGWKKKYIDCEEGENNAFASYGTLVHQMLQEYSEGQLDAFDMVDEYENRFDTAVPESFPPNKFVDLRESYYNKGRQYFETFTGVFDDAHEVLGVEKKVNFEIAGKPFVGYIDLLVKDPDGKVTVADHKSATAKFNKRDGKPAKSFADKMLSYRRQLYLYCKALIDEGIKPDYLCWNFFNDGIMYTILFNQEEYEEAIQWAEDTIKLIEEETEFEPTCSDYYCRNICDFRNNCEHCVRENWTGEEHYEP